MTLTVAVGELTRVLPWSLRALGYPFGTADRASHLVATAAALDPEVLNEIARAGHRPETGIRISRTVDVLQVRAEGFSLFEVGPAVMDYLAAHADEAAAVAAHVIGATHHDLLAAVVLIGAEHGLTTVALSSVQQDGGWIVGLPNDGDPMLHYGSGAADLLSTLQNTPLSDLVRNMISEPDPVLVATEMPVALRFAAAGLKARDVVAMAHSQGIPVKSDTLKAFYDLEILTWAPTSERSRTQAGFAPKKAVAA